MIRPLLTFALLSACATVASAQAPQPRGNFPLAPNFAPGLNARQAVLLDPTRRGWQTVKLSANGGGRVAAFDGPGSRRVLNESGLARIMVGGVYRFQVTDVPGFPGVELYPSVEVVDRLHPPLGRESEFPAPVLITDEDVRLAVAGRLVTKVVYVEDPALAVPASVPNDLPTATLTPNVNLLAEADVRGRPVLIVRLGGRTPDLSRPEPTFFGNGGPVQIPADPAADPAADPVGE